MPEDKPEPSEYDIHFCQGVEDWMQRCLKVLASLKTATGMQRSILDRKKAEDDYLKALESFNNSLTTMLASDGRGDVRIYPNPFNGGELSCEWKKGKDYEGGLAYHVRSGAWQIHT